MITRNYLESLDQRIARGEFEDIERKLKAIIEGAPPAEREKVILGLFKQVFQGMERSGFDKEDFRLLLETAAERFKRKIN